MQARQFRHGAENPVARYGSLGTQAHGVGQHRAGWCDGVSGDVICSLTVLSL